MEDILRRRMVRIESDDLFGELHLSNIRNRRFEPAIKAANVPRIRFHDLRHTFGSHLAMIGVPIIKIKELMGHSDIKITMRYMHLAPNQLQGCTEILLRGKRGVSEGSNIVEINRAAQNFG